MISKVFFLSADLSAQINVFRSMYVETLQSRHLCQFLQTKSACTCYDVIKQELCSLIYITRVVFSLYVTRVVSSC